MASAVNMPRLEGHADRLALRICDGCGNIHIDLKDEAGDVFATATIGVEQVDQHIDALRTLQAELIKRAH